MEKNHLRPCIAATKNVTLRLFAQSDDPDVTEKVIADVAKRFPKEYGAAVDQRGCGPVHSQMAKAVKKTLRATNLERSTSSAGAPSKTHTRLKAD